MEPNFDEACYLLGDVVERMFLPLVSITNTYRYVSRAVDVAAPQIVLEEVDQYGAFAMNPDFVSIFAHNYAEILDQSYRTRISGAVHSELQTVKRRVAASALIFAHAIFESCVSDCLSISFLASPDDWLPIISSKNIPVSVVTEDKISSFCSDLIETHIKSLENQSLLKKLDAFFQVTRPPDNHRRPTAYTYDRDRMVALDKARHASAHNDATGYDPDSLNEDVEYFRMTLIYLLGVLIEKYAVRNKPRPTSGP
jgi:hypothetical protein